jgi:hypothetical protein
MTVLQSPFQYLQDILKVASNKLFEDTAFISFSGKTKLPELRTVNSNQSQQKSHVQSISLHCAVAKEGLVDYRPRASFLQT